MSSPSSTPTPSVLSESIMQQCHQLELIAGSASDPASVSRVIHNIAYAMQGLVTSLGAVTAAFSASPPPADAPFDHEDCWPWELNAMPVDDVAAWVGELGKQEVDQLEPIVERLLDTHFLVQGWLGRPSEAVCATAVFVGDPADLPSGEVN